MNHFVLVGRLVENPKWEGIEDTDTKYVLITIGVQRTYKNMNGEYDTDIIKIRVYPYLATNVIDYCRKGDLLGVKGRIETNELVAEKLTFLTNANK